MKQKHITKGKGMQLQVKKSPAAPKIHTEIVTITPDIARQWLECNRKNRKAATSSVDKYARDIKTGRWELTGDTIKFDTNRNLLDGQHRLMACVKADTSFQTVVVYGLPPETQDVMDIGKVRQASDVLSLHGLNNTTAIAATARILLSERDGLSKPSGGGYSTAQILAVLEKHPKITRYIPVPGVLPRGISVGQVGYLNYVASEILGLAPSATAMMNVLKTGVPNYQGDPIHLYRERIIRAGDNEAVGLRRDSKWWTLKFAWNMFAEKTSVSTLRFGRDNCAIAGLNLKKL